VGVDNPAPLVLGCVSGRVGRRLVFVLLCVSSFASRQLSAYNGNGCLAMEGWGFSLKSEPPCWSCSFNSHCILATLEKNELCKTAQALKWVRYDETEPIFHQGAPIIGWYILCQGWAKLIFRASQGKRVLLKFCRPGDILGGIAHETHIVSAVAMGKAVASLLARDAAIALARQHPELALEANRQLARDRHMLLVRLAYLAHGSVRTRLAKGLLELGKQFGVRCEEGLRIELPLFQRDLADLIGTSRQTVCQELRKLVKRDLIQTKGRRIILTDLEVLRRLG